MRDIYMLALFLALFVIIYSLWQRWELTKFTVSHYEMRSKKINHRIKTVVISDLHSFAYGKHNERLFQAIKREKPDLVLIPGDLIVSSNVETYSVSLELVKRLVKLAPVFFSNGNHESRAEADSEDLRVFEAYMEFKRQMALAGVHILNNKTEVFKDKDGQELCISGLDLPLSCYDKGKKPYLEEAFMEEKLGQADRRYFQILLAHQPAFAPLYAFWGADLTVCGHNHGGLVRIPGIGSLVSPQFMLFPKYDAGEYRFGRRRVYVSRGLGTHTFHIRIFDRAELMSICLTPEES